jgi:G:T-mismatch repair DNA endonuclease (very short patch repair protein)
MLGKKHPKKTRQKMSESQSTPERIQQQREIRAKQKFPFKDSKPELLVQSILNKNGIKFKKHKSFKLSKSYHQADIVVEPNRAIEIFGDYWHFNPKMYDGESIQRKRRKQIKAKDVWKYDKYVINGMKKQGYKVLVVWESELKNELERTTKKILKFVIS